MFRLLCINWRIKKYINATAETYITIPHVHASYQCLKKKNGIDNSQIIHTSNPVKELIVNQTSLKTKCTYIILLYIIKPLIGFFVILNSSKL